jgi:hypothetical protein
MSKCEVQKPLQEYKKGNEKSEGHAQPTMGS